MLDRPARLTRISEIRRKELRQAAFAVLQKEGLAGMTLERVASHAGASKGIVLHYFRNKQELFEHAMREANAALRDVVVERLKRARTPMERLEAVIDGNFEPELFQPPTCHAWLSLCAEVPRDEKLKRVQKIIHARMHSNLMSGLRGLVAPERAREIALGISALIDGLWLRLGLEAGSVDRDEAVAQVKTYLDLHLRALSAPA